MTDSRESNEIMRRELEAEKTENELLAFYNYHIRRRARKPAPPIKLSCREGAIFFSVDAPNERKGYCILMEALGINDLDFLNSFIWQLIDAVSQCGESDSLKSKQRALNFVLSVVKGIAPNDQIEAMLAGQMAVTHVAMMMMSSLLTRSKNIAQQDSAERAFNKLARTFTSQTEALKRYRTGGQQKVTVEHVTVNRGGQAIVGNVTQTGKGEIAGKDTNALAAPTNGQSSSLPTVVEATQVSAGERSRANPR